MFWTNFDTYNTQGILPEHFSGGIFCVLFTSFEKHSRVHWQKSWEYLIFFFKNCGFFSQNRKFLLKFAEIQQIWVVTIIPNFWRIWDFFQNRTFLHKLAEIQICWNQQIRVKIPILRKNSQFLEKKDKIFYAFLQFTVPCKFCPTYTLVKITGTTLYICICVPVLTGFS